MNQVMIADDDRLVRQTIRSILENYSESFRVVGEAMDGIDAMEKIESLKPDILILDIGMPQANGIEVIQYVKKRGYATKILVLSCHNDFDYVKDAMKLGANDYQLKHLMKENTLMESLSMIQQEIEESKIQQEAKIHTELIAKEGTPFLKYKLIQKMLRGTAETSSLEQEFKMLLPHLQAGNLSLLYFRIPEFLDDPERHGSIEKEYTFYEMSKIYGDCLSEYQFEAVNDEDGRIFILLSADRRSSNEIRSDRVSLMSRIGKRIQDETNFVVQGITSLKSSSVHQLSKIYLELESKIQLFFYMEEGPRYLIAEDMTELSQESIDLNQEHINQYKMLIKECDFNQLRSSLECDIHKWEKRSALPRILKQYYLRLLPILMEYTFHYYKIPREHSIDDSLNHEIQRAGNAIALLSVILEFTYHLENLVSNDLVPSVENDYIRQALRYIQSHYAEDININDVASHIHVTPTYFSYLFKQHTGTKFIDYVKEIRIKKACELLANSEMKVKTVGERIGIPNRKYFSKSFRELVGMSPQEYKRQNI